MKLVDTNLLLYAVDETSAPHERARSWWEDQLNGEQTVALPTVVLLAFVRLTTKAQVFARPLSVSAALDLVDGWLARDQVFIPRPTNRHLPILRELLIAVGTGGNLVTDAHLATLAVEHGLGLYSHDADFSRFPGLHWVDPLEP